MVFQYAYRDAQNERHDGTLAASSKDEVFRQLRGQGIRPFFVAPAPGFWNHLLGLGKRGAAIILLTLLALVLGVLVLRAPHGVPQTDESRVFDAAINARTRRQPIGDVALIDAGIRTGWAAVFSSEGDRTLAAYAVPGVAVRPREVSEEALSAALGTTRAVQADDSLEARQIIAIVAGMKDELRAYRAAGGSFAGYLQALIERQAAEVDARQRARRAVEAKVREGRPEAEILEELDAYNRSLRRMGIKPLTLPAREGT